MFLDRRLELDLFALSNVEALATLVDEHVARGIFESVDVRGAEGTVKRRVERQGKLEVGTATNGANML